MAEGVLSPGNRPVCQPDAARGPTSREHPCKKKIRVFKAGAASVRARTGSYAAIRLGHGGVGLGTEKNVASQPNPISIGLGAGHLRDPGREDGRCLRRRGVTGRSIEIFPGRPGPSTPGEGRGVPTEKHVDSNQIFCK